MAHRASAAITARLSAQRLTVRVESPWIPPARCISPTLTAATSARFQTGWWSLIAGNGGSGFGGDNGPALNATFSDPNGITVDSAGNLYVPDAGNNRVRLLSSGAGGVTPLSITTSFCTNAEQYFQPYGPVTMAATGGSGNYSWMGSATRRGLNISTAGVVSGTPPAAASFVLTITVTSGTAAATATFQVTIAAQALPRSRYRAAAARRR